MNKEDLMKKFDEQMKIIQDKTGINPKIVLGVLGAALLLTLIGWLDKYITCLVAIVLPTYWSIKAIETKEGDDDKQWLTYWAVYACFTFLDLFAGFIMKFLPFYFFMKLIFLIWCFMPNTQGAIYIYNYVILKIFKKYESRLDRGINKFMKKSNEMMKKAEKTIEENKGVLKEAAKAATDALKSN